ncbi:MAG: DUF4097 family beta strand repeat protein, partial [Euryarchaeota archaeon]|nr:DUF4097 family beta strand repeat protein [Euryarchaeota archaeon]
MTRNLFPVLILALLTAPLAGCVELTDPGGTSPSPTGSKSSSPTSSAPSTSHPSGTMTAKEANAVSSGPCPSGTPPFCATKTHWIDGALDLERIPVDLEGFNGNVEVKGGSAGAWNLTVVLSARGTSADAARSNLDNIVFSWGHETSGGHEIRAQASRKNPQLNNNEGASMTLIVPASVFLTLQAASTNGAAVAQGIRGDSVDLATSNGRVALLNAEFETVKLRSTNGEADVDTVSAQTIDVATSNANIVLAANAKDVKLASSNAAIEV